MKGVPMAPVVRPGRGPRHLGHRHYDEVEIRTLRAEGLSAVQIKDRLGCSIETISLALDPTLREMKRQVDSQASWRRRTYRNASEDQLYQWSDRHYNIVFKHQTCLDEIEREIQRRRQAAQSRA